MQHSYKGVHANWHYSKNCWVFKLNGIIHYCYEDEVDDTIDALLSDE